MPLLPIHNQASPYWDSLVRVYLTSFPIDEQRPVESILRLLTEEPRYTLYAVIDDDENDDDNCHPESLHCGARSSSSLSSSSILGILTTWTFDGFTYIEHFALSPKVRGLGHGTEALQQLIAQTTQPLILEAEPPTDAITRRRIGFYERSGFTLYDYPYQQPAYTTDSQPVPLCLMGHRLPSSLSLNHIARTLHREVYGCR